MGMSKSLPTVHMKVDRNYTLDPSNNYLCNQDNPEQEAYMGLYSLDNPEQEVYTGQVRRQSS